MSRKAAIKTHDQVRTEFCEAGITIKGWAEQRGYPPSLVYSILADGRRCNRGKSHEIAVALGIKRSVARAA